MSERDPIFWCNRAVEEALWSPASGPVVWSEEKLAATKEQAAQVVRAVLANLREPGREAVLAACRECAKEQVRPVSINIVDVITVWETIIDHFLAEGAPCKAS